MQSKNINIKKNKSTWQWRSVIVLGIAGLCFLSSFIVNDITPTKKETYHKTTS